MSIPIEDGKRCTRCLGHGRIDDMGYIWRGQPAFAIHDCPRCGGSGKEPLSELYSYKQMEEAESAIDFLESIAK